MMKVVNFVSELSVRISSRSPKKNKVLNYDDYFHLVGFLKLYTVRFYFFIL